MRYLPLLLIVMAWLFRSPLGLAAPRNGAPDDFCPQLLRQAEKWSDAADKLEEQGQFTQAEQLALQSLQVRERCLGEDHLLVAESLHILAKIYFNLQQYIRAIPIEQRSMSIREKRLGKNHREVARSLNLLASYYDLIGDYRRSAELFQRAVQILELPENIDHPAYPSVLNNLGDLELKNSHYELAELRYQQAKARWIAMYGTEHFIVGCALCSLAELHAKMGRSRQALAETEQALAIWRKTLGPRHPLVATGLTVAARIHFDLLQHKEAERAYREALQIQLVALGTLHPDLGKTRQGLALLYARMGRLVDACKEAELAMDSFNNYLHSQGQALSEEQYALFVSSVQADEDALYSALSAHLGNRHVAALLLSLALHRKGRTLDEAAEFSRVVYRELSPADRAQYDRLRTLRSQFAALSLAGPGLRGSVASFRKRLDELSADANTLEEDLAQRSALLRQRRSIPKGTQILSRVRAALPSGTALVEYVNFRVRDKLSTDPPPAQPHRYLAFVLTAKGLAAADLGEARKIDDAAQLYHLALRDSGSSERRYLPAGQALLRLLLTPIDFEIKGADRLLVSPDGALNNVPFSALYDGAAFLEDRFLLSYVTSGRDLLRRPPQPAASSEVVVFADPSFDTPTPDFLVADAARSAQRGRLRMQLGRLAPLPGTRAEALAIQQLFPSARLLLKDAATESALLSLAAPAILHIATHGLFVEDAPDRPAVRSVHSHFDESEPPVPTHPLLRSALILAGAGARRPEASGSDSLRSDGIITALELAGMNLWGTQLVVLSACSSGRGIVKIGQGVYGLRRAIITAGAAALVTSLWRVDDAVTQELMSAFYTRLVSGIGRAEALRQAARETRASHPHPYYWAAFILIGEAGRMTLANAKP